MQEAFADIARVESDCGSADRGGDLGAFGPGILHSISSHSILCCELSLFCCLFLLVFFQRSNAKVF